MKRFFKILLYISGTIVLLIIILIAWIEISGSIKAHKYGKLAGVESPTITIDGLTFRDLNKNGKLDVYEDLRKPTEERVTDLVSQMNLEEKAGCMFIPPISIGKYGKLSEKPTFNDFFSWASEGTSLMLYGKHLNHFNIFVATKSGAMVDWYNAVQKAAEKTRLGIPVTIASDPRNHFSNNPLAGAMAGDFSLWPEPLGLAATRDSSLVEKFGDIARQEYLSVGIRVALHPMADLATEPRWGRINGTFGEDAQLTSMMVYSYIKGFQGDSLGLNSIACMTKHFSGGGPQKEGLDPHFPIAKGQIYPGKNFNYHLIPFEAAFRAGTAEIMPYYGIPMDQTSENVGFSFNQEIITGLLRNKYHFDGIVCTDWGILTDSKMLGIMILPARARGMEKFTPEERMLKVIRAGVDQFGGETLPDMLIKLVKDGKITEARIDSTVRRLLRMKFVLGLFDHPYLDRENAIKTVGKDEFRMAGQLAQRKSMVLLKNDTNPGGKYLPLKQGIKIYVKNMSAKIAGKYGIVVGKPEDADICIIRINAPSQKIKGMGLLGGLFHSGDLDFKDKEKNDILSLLRKIPTIVDIYQDRPAVIPEIAKECKALLTDFGAEDAAVMDVIFGKFTPSGRLPFEMPLSMEAVRNQKEDLPYDSANPLFSYGFGLSY
jgi:beta-glucosidase